MPPTKDKNLMLVQKALPRLYIATPDTKLSKALFVGKIPWPPVPKASKSATPPPLPKAAMAKPPKPPGAAMLSKPKSSLPGLTPRGKAALEAVPDKSITSEEDDEGDE